MHDDSPTIQPSLAVVATRHGATVTNLASRRRNGDVLRSITFVFGGVNYGTIEVSTPYTHGKPIVLYVVSDSETIGRAGFGGSVDCLVTDDADLSADVGAAQ